MSSSQKQSHANLTRGDETGWDPIERVYAEMEIRQQDARHYFLPLPASSETGLAASQGRKHRCERDNQQQRVGSW